MSIQKKLKELLDEGVIDDATVNRIEAYYASKPDDSLDRILGIFRVVGAFLVGLGIVLIINHNWYWFPKGVKIVIAFLPVLCGYLLCFYSLRKQGSSIGWNEASSIVLTFAIGSCIGMLSQIYQLQGSLRGFLLMWTVLALPIVYVMRSYIVALLCLASIIAINVNSYVGQNFKYIYFAQSMALVIALLPFYRKVWNGEVGKHAFGLFHWLFPAIIVTGVPILFFHARGNTPMVGFVSLYTICYMVGLLEYFDAKKMLQNGYRVIGAIGVVGVFLLHSFSFAWDMDNRSVIHGLVEWAVFGIALLGLGFLVRFKQKVYFQPLVFLFIAFFILTLVDESYAEAKSLAVNFLLLVTGGLTIWNGLQKKHLGILNFGLVIISATIVCRVFDSSIPFIVRGVFFILMGIVFFIANNNLIKNRKNGL